MRDFESSEKLYQLMRCLYVQPDIVIYTQMMQLYYKTNQTERAMNM